MFSWLTGSGYFQQDEFDGDRDRLAEFYHNHGYLDFEIKDMKLDRPTTNIDGREVLRFRRPAIQGRRREIHRQQDFHRRRNHQGPARRP